MKEIKRYQLGESHLTLLQFKMYEMEGLRVLNAHICQSNTATSEQREVYLKQYKDAFAEYNLTFDEIIKCHTGEYATNKYHHTVDFLTGEIIVREKQEATK